MKHVLGSFRTVDIHVLRGFLQQAGFIHEQNLVHEKTAIVKEVFVAYKFGAEFRCVEDIRSIKGLERLEVTTTESWDSNRPDF